jgi:hypothetical protein
MIKIYADFIVDKYVANLMDFNFLLVTVLWLAPVSQSFDYNNTNFNTHFNYKMTMLNEQVKLKKKQQTHETSIIIIELKKN